jgi:NADH-quinone oxidoreductase subunit N
MVFGNLGAVGQKSVKRMLAYSSIAHAGYILIGVVAASKVGQQAVSAVLYYLAAYTVSNALAFGALIAAGSEKREAVTYEDLAGLGRRHPMLAVPFVLGVLSLMGFPPTAGFFAKYYVFAAAVQAGGGMVWLAVLGAVTSAIGAYYYLRVLVFLFMREPEAGAVEAIPMRSGYVIATMVIAGILVLQMGVAPSGYIDLAAAAAKLFA